jgi:hypothetical protein
MTSALHVPFDSDSFEPDERWKANLREKIDQGLISVVNDAKAALADILAKAPVTELQRDLISREHVETLSQIRRLGQEQFDRSLEAERAERRLAADKHVDLKSSEPEPRRGSLDAESGLIEEVDLSWHGVNTKSDSKLTGYGRQDADGLRTETEDRIRKEEVRKLRANIRLRTEERTEESKSKESVGPFNFYERPTSAAPSATTRRGISLEPDEAWKAILRDRIEQGLMPMVRDAKAALAEKLAKAPVTELQRDLISRNHMETMSHIRRLGQEQLEKSLEVERAERPFAADNHVDPKSLDLEPEMNAVDGESTSIGRGQLNWKGKDKSSDERTEYGVEDDDDVCSEPWRKQQQDTRRIGGCVGQDRIESDDFYGKLTSMCPPSASTHRGGYSASSTPSPNSSTSAFSNYSRRGSSSSQTAASTGSILSAHANEPALFMPKSADPSAPGGTSSFEEWPQQHEEHAIRLEENFRREQKYTEPNKLGSRTEYEVTRWNKISTWDRLRWDSFPWPMFGMPSNPKDLHVAAIRAYVLSSDASDTEKSAESRIKEQLRRWHPDRFESKFLPKVIEREWHKVKDGAG